VTDEQVEQAVLQYLNGDSSEERHFRSLTTIFEMVMKPREPRADADDLEDEVDTKEELRAVLDTMADEGLLESRWGERDYEASYRLTDEGAYQASGFDQYVLHPLSNAILTEDGEPLETEDGEFLVMEDSNPPRDGALPESPITVDSAAWTGLIRVTIDARNAKAVSGMIDHALISLSSSQAGNFQIMQATAYLKAAKELVEAPEPPSDEIWRLISKAANLVGLFGVFYGIFVQAMN
jgi:hypothetical protein